MCEISIFWSCSYPKRQRCSCEEGGAAGFRSFQMLQNWMLCYRLMFLQIETRKIHEYKRLIKYKRQILNATINWSRGTIRVQNDLKNAFNSLLCTFWRKYIRGRLMKTGVFTLRVWSGVSTLHHPRYSQIFSFPMPPKLPGVTLWICPKQDGNIHNLIPFLSS